MSSNELVEQIMAQVIARVATPEHEVLPKTTHQIRETAMAEKSCTLTEFVGTAIGDTVGLVIANVDSALLDAMKLEKRYRSIGILGARIGAGPHIMAADEAVKATNTEVISIELPRDTKGGALSGGAVCHNIHIGGLQRGVGHQNTHRSRSADNNAASPSQWSAKRFFQCIAGAGGILQLKMSGFVGIDIAKGPIEFFQGDFNTAFHVRNIVAT